MKTGKLMKEYCSKKT